MRMSSRMHRVSNQEKRPPRRCLAGSAGAHDSDDEIDHGRVDEDASDGKYVKNPP